MSTYIHVTKFEVNKGKNLYAPIVMDVNFF